MPEIAQLLADNWLRHVHDVRQKYFDRLAASGGGEREVDRLCELNVIEQVGNVCRATVVRDAWQRGQPLSVHGWIYGLHDGLLCDLGVSVSQPGDLEEAGMRARARLPALRHAAG